MSKSENLDYRIPPANPSVNVSFGATASELTLSSHVAYFWNDEKEFADAVKFLETGLSGSDHCVIFGHDTANQMVCQVLRDAGYDVDLLIAARRITILGGATEASDIIAKIGDAFQKSLADGAPLIRLLGNIGWGKANWPDDKSLLAFEAQVTEAVKRFPCVVVCMYDVAGLTGSIVHHGGIGTHPQIVCNGQAQANPHHVPTETFLRRLETVAGSVAERRRNDETLHHISEGTVQYVGEDFFRQLARHLAEALRVRYCFLTECTDDSQTRVRALAFWGGDRFAQNIEYPLRGTPCEKVIEGNICSYPDRLQLLFPEDQDLVTLGAESYTGVPLPNAAGRVLGHLVVMDNRAREFGPTELRILRIFATRAGIELERSRADAALKANERRLNTLLEINNAIVSKLSRDELFAAVADALARTVCFDRLALSLYDPELNALKIVTHAGTYERTDYTPVGRVLLLDDSPVGQAFVQQTPIVRPNLEIERLTASEERAYTHGFRSICALPLIVRGQSIGVITLGSLTPYQYSQDDADLLLGMASQIAIAVANMKSYEEIDTLNAALSATAQRLKTLLDINNAIGRYLVRDELFGALADRLQSLVPTERFGIELPIEGDKLQGHILSSVPKEGEATALTVLPAAGTACDWVLRQREWFVASSRDQLRERFPVTFEVMATQGMESLCALPLVSGECALGALFFMASAKDAYAHSPVGFLQQVAHQIAIAVENMQLHEETARLKARYEAEAIYLQEEIKTEHNFEEIIGRSMPLRQLLRNLEQVAPTETTVLIRGETGTGKELLARAVHDCSLRKDRPLVKVNCGAIPAGLVESELFGHEKGAFTGATQRRIGRFELANGGTIFLDEVTELPLDTQVKLLRVLQEGEFERVGSSQTIKVDTRVIAASNRNLQDVVKNGSFRSDLFYRLNVFPLEVPALRERREDIPLLVNFFLSRFAKKLGKELRGVAQRSMESLMDYDWPGNIRELQNVVERAAVVATGPIVHVDASLLRTQAAAPQSSIETLEEMERAHIIRALKETNWLIQGKGGAATLLGINPSTLRSRMEKLGIRKAG